MKRKNKSDLSQETLFGGPDEKAVKREKEKARKLRQRVNSARPLGGKANSIRGSAIIVGTVFRERSLPWTTLFRYQEEAPAPKGISSSAVRNVIIRKNPSRP
jgi:hypothetical protein